MIQIDGKPVVFAIVDMGGGRFTFCYPQGPTKMQMVMLLATQLEDLRLQAHVEFMQGGPSPIVAAPAGALPPNGKSH